jgi:TolB-like protein
MAINRPFDAYRGDEPYYFVSYAHKDAAVAYPELIRFRELGFNIWYDEGISPGAEWREELASAIRRSSGFLLLVTPNSVASENCRNEINFALDEGCPFLSIHLEATNLPDGLKLALNARQALLKYSLTRDQYESKLRLFDDARSAVSGASVESKGSRSPGRSGFSLRQIAGVLLVVVSVALAALYFTPKEDSPQVIAESIPPQKYGRSVAVLPLTNMSGDDANIPFTNGIHDDLLTHISWIKALKTTSRTSVLQYRNTTKTIPQIGEELGVAAILEGSIQRSGNLVRVNMQLIDTATDEHLWAEIYDRELTTANLFQVQGEIATAVADALRVNLLASERAEIVAAPTDSMEAYDLYLLGRHEWNKRTAQSIERSRNYFREALQIDPNFTRAMSGLADSYIQLVEYGNMRGAVAFPLAEEIIGKAMLVDDSVSELWASLGSLRQGQNHIDEAGKAFEKALELDPKNFSAWMWYGDFLNKSTVRRYDEGLAALEKAESLEPMSRVLNEKLLTAYFKRGDFAANRAHAERAAIIDPASARKYESYIAGNLSSYGELAQSVFELRKLAVKYPGTVATARNLVNTYILLQDFEEAGVWARRVDAMNAAGRKFADVLFAEGNYGPLLEGLEGLLESLEPSDPAIEGIAFRLFELTFLDGQIRKAAAYLQTSFEAADRQVTIRPGEYLRDHNLKMADFWLLHGDADQAKLGERVAHETRENLVRITSQGYRRPNTLIMLGYAHALVGDINGMYSAMDEAIDRGFRDLSKLNTIARTEDIKMRAEFLERIHRVEALIAVEKDKLAAMELPPYSPYVKPARILLDREQLQAYEGLFVSGGALVRFHLDEGGGLSKTVGERVTDKLYATALNVFQLEGRSGVVYEFVRDNDGELVHVLRKERGQLEYLKPYPPQPATVSVARKILENYQGSFVYNPLTGNPNVAETDLMKIQVQIDGQNGVWIKRQQRGRDRFKIEPYSNNEFLSRGKVTRYRFEADAISGQYDRLVEIDDRGELIFERTK